MFLGTHQNRLDAKGRVSIPAPFRSVLRQGQGQGQGPGAASLVLRPSHNYACVEGWPEAEFAALAAPLARLDLFSKEHDALATALYADAYPVEADREGRIVLPDRLRLHANLEEAVVFMGLGRTFQIWEPAAAERWRAELRQRANAAGMTLPAAAG
ncbi:MAG: division/cell wall cluster transcriptional repressor MraZ [Acidisphaera sp.]|nr:division/cell wall cluster transcriptional repressor MraZ [Acidisphaera sp.]